MFTWNKNAEIRCRQCAKPITGAYIKALGYAWHEHHFNCSKCKQNLSGNTFHQKKNKQYCYKCFLQLFGKTCYQCKKPIEEKCINAMNQFWHSHCFCCNVCSKPLQQSQFVMHAGQPCHKSCYHQKYSPKCLICEAPLAGKYRVNGWGQRYCMQHEKQLPACFCCGRLICNALTGGGSVLHDGRMVCQLCERTSVNTVKQGETSILRVKRFFNTAGFAMTGSDFPIHLVDLPELKRLSGKRSTQDPTGLTRTLLKYQQNKQGQNRRIMQKQVKDVLVLFGLPEEQFAAVIAHEFCHAWLFLNDVFDLPIKTEEGICTLCEYFWLQNQATDDAKLRMANIEKSKDSIYGDGFRNAYRSLNGLTLAQLLFYVKQHGRLPATGLLGFLKRHF